MLLTITETFEKCVEIQLPAYFKYGSCLFKILSEQKYIEVANGENEMGIRLQTCAGVVGLVVNNGDPIDEVHFDLAYHSALELLTNKIFDYKPELTQPNKCPSDADSEMTPILNFEQNR